MNKHENQTSGKTPILGVDHVMYRVGYELPAKQL